MNLLDASALLAFLQGEAGAELVEGVLIDGAMCGAANWSETAQKVASRGGDWALARALVLSYGLTVEPVTLVDGERAAELWSADRALSLGDRLCLAQGERLQATVWTADTEWGTAGGVRQIR